MFPLLAIAATVCAGDATGAGTNKGSPETRASTTPRVSTETLDEFSLADQLVPLPADLEIRTVVVTAGTSGGGIVTDGSAAFNDTARLVYSNTLGPSVLSPPMQLPQAILADDITTTADEGCSLDRYSVLVTGDVRPDDVDDGPFSVDLALYDACPRAGGAIIPGTEAQVTLPNDGLFAIVVVVPTDADLPIPNSLYVGISFSRLGAGVVMGAPALVGVSGDRLDHPAAGCRASLGGFPVGPHASFWAQIYVREPCRKTFPGFLNTNHGGPGYSPGGGRWFTDKIRLGVFPCNMTAYEVAGKGSGVVLFDLRTHLDFSDLESGVIPGTRSGMALPGGDDISLGRVDFDPPLPLPSRELFVAFQTTSAAGGPVYTGKRPTVGESLEHCFSPGSPLYPCVPRASAFEIAITCAGEAPSGACCDMFITDDGGDSVCRELPEMNCAVPELWEEGTTCESTCVGGDSNGLGCTRQADCPGGACPGPLEHPCGVGACCTPDDTCEDLTNDECSSLAAPGENILWQRGYFCDNTGCPPFACRQHEGDCAVARTDPGCQDPFCCAGVCKEDPFCCTVAWDVTCVLGMQESQECLGRRPRNTLCATALSIEASSETIHGPLYVQPNVDYPDIPCHTDDPDSPRIGSAWFRFEATDTSARIHTCNTPSPDFDSLLQVFRVTEDATLDTECDHLEAIACNDDAVGCGTGLSSAVCVDGLVPGEPYFVQLAAKTEEFEGLHQLDLESPCDDPTASRCPPAEIVFLDPPSGTVDARRTRASDGENFVTEGIDTLLVAAPPEAYRQVCWSVCESASEGIVDLAIAEVSAGREGTFTILLDRPLTPGVVTTVTYTDDQGTESTGRFLVHPSNVNGDVVADVQDLAAMVDILSGTLAAPWGTYSTDCDHSGSTTPADLLCFVDLLQPTDSGEAGWNDTPVPQDTGRCERVCGGASGITCPDGQFCKPPVGTCGGALLGFCTSAPTNCAEDFDPVCGCDGITYDNECRADADNASIAHHGGCSP